MQVTTDPPELRRGDPVPLAIGTVLNLRREMPGGPRAELDQGWTVAGYTVKGSGKWLGYQLAKGNRSTSCSKFEAVDVKTTG